MKKKCINCNKIFKTKREVAKYCSRKCSAIYRTKNPVWRKEQAERARKQSLIKNPFKGKHHTKETIEKLKKINTGRKCPSGKNHYNWKDIKPRCKTCNKLISKYKYIYCQEHCGKKGDKNPMWKGGLSFINYPQNWTKTLKQSIRIRDNYTCKICNKFQSNLDKRQFAVHHIDYNKKNCSPDNLITLCHSCHNKTNHKRDYWINYFKNNE